MEKQKVKVDMEHFTINLSNINCLIIFLIKKRPLQTNTASLDESKTDLNFVKNNCLKCLNQK